MKERKIAFVFPGQGAQKVGMAKEFYKNENYKRFFERANKRLEFDLTKIMLEGPKKELKETYNTQPAILLHSALAYLSFKKNFDIEPKFVAGHSLGEFSALFASNVLRLEDALHLVHKRGIFMVEASKGIPYEMAAILGLKKDIIIKICKDIQGTVVAANFNTPKQTVISGEKEAVSEAMKSCKENGAKRVVTLTVGGAFHSPLIKKSEEWLTGEMEKIKFSKPTCPIIANVNAKPEQEPNEIKTNLAKQIFSPVRWVESVNYMIDKGVDTFIEFGPGRVISGMIRRIDRKVDRFNVRNFKDLEKLKDKIAG